MFDFAEKTLDMTAIEILNYYRNLYYAELQVTERGIVANALNDILPKMIIPPIEVGQTVYSPRKHSVLEQRANLIEIDQNRRVRVAFACDYDCDGCPHYQPYENQAGDGGCWGEYGEGYLDFADFGKTVFLTPEEAEAALAGGEQS